MTKTAAAEVTDNASGGKRATIKWRGAKYVITIDADGDDAAEATTLASTIAKQVYEGLQRQRNATPGPGAAGITALLPPQAQLAIRTAGVIGKLATSGQLGRYMDRLPGPARRLASLVMGG